MNKIIIGGGISGLIAAYYNDDYLIISKDIGGQMANGYLGPRILEESKSSKQFLKDLGYPLIRKTANIGYQINNNIYPETDDNERMKYYKKSRCLKNTDDVPSSIMSSGKNHINYFEVEWDKIIQKMLLKIGNRIINHNVISIEEDNKKIILDDSSFVVYENIISTIPAPIFYKIINEDNDNNFKYIPKLFIIVSTMKFPFFCNLYDYIYYITNFKFHRITKIGKYLAVEYTTEEDLDNILSEWEFELEASFKLKYGQIVSGSVDDFENIEFLGRYAEWNHKIKINDVLDRFILRSDR